MLLFSCCRGERNWKRGVPEKALMEGVGIQKGMGKPMALLEKSLSH